MDLVREFDRDGALAEAADRVANLDVEEVGHSRASFLKRAGAGAAVVMGGGAFAGVLPALARGATLPQSDIDILNYALTLEYLEAQFYADAKTKGALTGLTRRFAFVVGNHEADHVKFIQKVLGSKAVATPTFDFKGTTTNMGTFQATADTLENIGVHAYLGQVGNIKTKAVLLGAGRILPVEARHASWIRAIRYPTVNDMSKETPAPAPFEDGFSKATILGKVSATGFIQ